MNKLIAGLFGVALMSGSAFADTGAPAPSAKDLTKAVEKVNYVETDVTGVKLNGYVDVGYIYNFTGQGNIANRVGSDATHGGDFNVNTVKLTVSKDLTNKNEWQAGFRTDLMFGEDAGALKNNYTGSASEFFLQQGYVVFRAPFGNGIDIKAGKFASWLGYEVTERPANLNITYGDMYTFLPATMTGVSLEYPICNSLDVGLAIGNGQNDSNLGWDNNSDGYGIMAKVNYKVPGGNANWQNSVYYSWDSAYESVNPLAYSGGDKNIVMYDTVFNWAPKFANGKLLIGVNGDLGYAEGVDIYGGDNGSSTLWGAALYSKYQFTDIFSLAGRFSYVHTDDNGVLFTKGNYYYENGDNYSFTLTAGFNVVENLVIRAEYRCDLGDDTVVYNSGATNDFAHTVALQAVYTF